MRIIPAPRCEAVVVLMCIRRVHGRVCCEARVVAWVRASLAWCQDSRASAKSKKELKFAVAELLVVFAFMQA